MRDLYHIFVHVAYGCASVVFRRLVAVPRGRGNFGDFLPHWQYIVCMGHIAIWISLRRTDLAWIYLFIVMSDIIQFSIIKEHNCD